MVYGAGLKILNIYPQNGITEEMVLEKLDRMDRKSVYSGLTVIITY
jgi:hypothetical protein